MQYFCYLQHVLFIYTKKLFELMKTLQHLQNMKSAYFFLSCFLSIRLTHLTPFTHLKSLGYFLSPPPLQMLSPCWLSHPLAGQSEALAKYNLCWLEKGPAHLYTHPASQLCLSLSGLSCEKTPHTPLVNTVITKQVNIFILILQ